MFYLRITESTGVSSFKTQLPFPDFMSTFGKASIHVWGGSLPKMVTIWAPSQGFEDDKFLQEITFFQKRGAIKRNSLGVEGNEVSDTRKPEPLEGEV